MKSQILPAIRLTLVSIIVFVVFYTGLVWAGAQVVAPNGGKGAVIEKDGKIIGFANVGQKFDTPQYFWSRPSAVGYNAAASGGSNKGPTNPDYLKDVESRIDTFLKYNPSVQRAQIPSEMVTASGSGLDPHISPQGALVQAERIAQVRHLPIEKVKDLIEKNTEKSLLSPPVINVLKLNLALDNLK